MNLKERIDYYRQNKHKLVRLFFLFVLVVLIIITGYLLLPRLRDQVTTSMNYAQAIITPRYWEIVKITPDSAGTNFTLDLKSNIGNIRTYTNIISYGLSNDGKLLAIHNNEGVYVISLEDESKKTVKIPSDKFSGDLAEVIDWNKDNLYFSLPVVVPTPAQHTEIWLFQSNGDLYSKIAVDIPVSESGKSIVEPVYFAEKSDTILARIYKKDDLEFVQDSTSNYSVYKLPIYLDTFNLKGEMIEEFNVRDYDATGATNILYFWNKDSDYIEYNIYKDSIPDKSRDYLFTKQSITP